MINRIKNHLLENSGDENVSKMTWVAIIFVVGAILLLLTTTAFKEPIQNWYKDTVAEWFNGENGQYSYNKWSMYKRNENGTYEGIQYVLEFPNGDYWVVSSDVNELPENGTYEGFYTQQYNANGEKIGIEDWFAGQVEISNDGRTISYDGWEFHAKLP